jgi:ABC-type nitrate/sulfonate/bicarbonate transport system substrate-binding protein
MIENNPDVVQRLMDSIVAGVEFTISNPQKAIEHTLSFNEELVEEQQLRRLEATIPLMNVPDTEIGSMSPEIWQFTYDLLAGQGIVDETFDVTEVYTQAFENSASE